MLDERLRNHIDGAAMPVELDEVLRRTPDAEPRAVERDHGERPTLAAATPVLEFDSVPAGAQSSRRKLPVAIAAAGVVIVGAVLLILAAQRASEPSILASDRANTELPALPSGLTDTEWRGIEEPFAPLEAGNAVEVTSATVVGGMAWAAGFEWRIEIEDDGIEAKKRGAIWRSEDGETWAPIDAEFGSFDLPGGNWAPSGISFSHIVGTADGAIWAFGNEFRDSITPVGYRSTDGSEWTAIDMSAVPDVSSESMLLSASSDGATAQVVMSEGGELFDERVRVATTTNGTSWSIDFDLASPEAFSAVAHQGELTVVTNEALPGEQVWSTVLAATTNGFVAAGEAGRDVTNEDIPSGQVGLLWHSADGKSWAKVGRLAGRNVPMQRMHLLAHDAGVLAGIEWAGDDDGVDLIDIDPVTGDFVDLGTLPVEALRSMFVLDARLFIIGSGFDEVNEDSSVWVAAELDLVAESAR